MKINKNKSIEFMCFFCHLERENFSTAEEADSTKSMLFVGKIHSAVSFETTREAGTTDGRTSVQQRSQRLHRRSCSRRRSIQHLVHKLNGNRTLESSRSLILAARSENRRLGTRWISRSSGYETSRSSASPRFERQTVSFSVARNCRVATAQVRSLGRDARARRLHVRDRFRSTLRFSIRGMGNDNACTRLRLASAHSHGVGERSCGATVERTDRRGDE